jgi:large subunit ribosomal protein L1
MYRGKRYRSLREKVDRSRQYPLQEAVGLMKDLASAKFNETVEIAMRLGVDPRHADQVVRGTIVLPHGTGKSPTILVFAQGELATQAQEAGADFVGAEDIVNKIQKEGWLGFDACIAAPDMMPVVGKLGRVLGPRGLMPNPKSGTVTANIKQAIEEIKKGKIEFRVDKAGILHAPIGKTAFTAQQIFENALSFIDAVVRARPTAAKGQYVKAVSICSTMGPGIPVDYNDALTQARTT